MATEDRFGDKVFDKLRSNVSEAISGVPLRKVRNSANRVTTAYSLRSAGKALKGGSERVSVLQVEPYPRRDASGRQNVSSWTAINIDFGDTKR